MMNQILPYAPYTVLAFLAFVALMLAFKWREVVPTNDVLSARGGQAIGAALEGLKETSEAGAALVQKVTRAAAPTHLGNGGKA